MKKGYIYTMFAGADPGQGWRLTDPIFSDPPTLGACMPNIRRCVEKGDEIFVVSGRVSGVSQYVVGGFKVDQKLEAIEAYHKYPQYRQTKSKHGTIQGNIICDASGNHNEFDYHSGFEERVHNYIVGKDPIRIESPPEVQLARDETVQFLGDLFKKDGRTVTDVIGRWRRMNEAQIESIRTWINGLRKRAN